MRTCVGVVALVCTEYTGSLRTAERLRADLGFIGCYDRIDCCPGPNAKHEHGRGYGDAPKPPGPLPEARFLVCQQNQGVGRPSKRGLGMSEYANDNSTCACTWDDISDAIRPRMYEKYGMIIETSMAPP